MKKFFRFVVGFLTNRLIILSVVLFFMLSILVARLFELQIINGKRLEENFDLQVMKEIDIEGQRGIIYDRNGTPLATNKIAYTVEYDNSTYSADKDAIFLDLIRILFENDDTLSIDFPIYIDQDGHYQFVDSPSKTKRLKMNIYGAKVSSDLTTEQENATAQDVIDYLCAGDFFDISDEEITDKSINNEELLALVEIRYILWTKSYYKFIPQEIATDISQESLAEIKENRDTLDGMSVVEDAVRTYLYPEYVAHIIGYSGTATTDDVEEYSEYGYDENDIVGRVGLEKSMDLYLHPQKGKETVETSRMTQTMKVLDRTEPTAGKNIFTTIDLDLQIAAQDALVKQLDNIISLQMIAEPNSSGVTRVPTLGEMFYSMFDNKTISIDDILSSDSSSPYSETIKTSYNTYFENITESVKNELDSADKSVNETLSRYNDYLLDTLESDGYLNADYDYSSGYSDYSNNNISFNGLLNYLIRNDYIDMSKVVNDESIDIETMSDNEKYTYLKDKLLIDDYLMRYQFSKNVFLEMVDDEDFSYRNLAMVLVEQGVIDVDETAITNLENGRVSALNFMKTVISDQKLTPQQLGVDPSTGAVVVVDVNSGDVLALVSYPSYDTNKISDYSYYQDLLNDSTNPLYPTATQGKTAPGSTFKMVSAVAGLEEGVIDRYTHVTCTGLFTKVSPPVACWLASGHGSVDVVTAIAVSCNSFFNEVGYRLGCEETGTYNAKSGDEILNKYVSMFGLDSTSGIELTESEPSTPGSVTDGISNTVTATMGQEFNSYTPTEMARYLATVANGGTLYDLTLIDRIYNSDGSVYMEKEPVVAIQNDFAQETIDTVQEGMTATTQSSRGTARSYFSDYPITVAAKTGTAQEDLSRASHAVFATYAPVEDPEIAIIVEIPYSYTSPLSSGYIVGTVAKEIYTAYYEFDEEKDIQTYDTGFGED